ncbi:hypothetical protein [Marinomonas mediterranea]|uniref:hypothetical protein n=1 Tax=Marinomonas mediterranea TaxID=119864 RepID=UPI001CC02F50|nr:hypothetical protein [Marinomonas mediterranea]
MKRLLHTSQTTDLSWLQRLVKNRFLFPALHFQLFAIPLVLDVTWSYAIFWYLFMMLSIFLIHMLPLYLHRPIALLIVIIAIVMGPTLFSVPTGLEWLSSIFIIKLVLSHCVREEPYRPDDQKNN